MITVRNVVLRRGAKVVLDGASFTLNPGEKAGLVGRNGAGKSSLFALLTDRLHADRGDVDVPPKWRVGEVAQHMPETDQGATDFVLDGDLPLVAAKAELAAAEEAHDGEAMAHAHVSLEEAGAGTVGRDAAVSPGAAGPAPSSCANAGTASAGATSAIDRNAMRRSRAVAPSARSTWRRGSALARTSPKSCRP